MFFNHKNRPFLKICFLKVVKRDMTCNYMEFVSKPMESPPHMHQLHYASIISRFLI